MSRFDYNALREQAAKQNQNCPQMFNQPTPGQGPPNIGFSPAAMSYPVQPSAPMGFGNHMMGPTNQSSGMPGGYPTFGPPPASMPGGLPSYVPPPSSMPGGLPSYVSPSSGMPGGMPSYAPPSSGMPGGMPSYAPPSSGMPGGLPTFVHPSSGMPSVVPSSGITPSFAYSSASSQPDFGSSIEWIPTTSRDALAFSDRAVVGGYESDGGALWVIRARYQGDVIPGKFSLKYQAAYVPWNGNENCVSNFEVCCARPEKITWVASRDGVIPHNAVAAGNTSNGEPLYVGRAREQRSLMPGKIHPSHRVLYTSFGGKELAHKSYEIMCKA